MPTVDLTATSFSSTIEDNGIVLIDFWAEYDYFECKAKRRN